MVAPLARTLAVVAVVLVTASLAGGPAAGGRRPAVTVSTSSAAFSPNGDGSLERVRITVSVDVGATVSVSVLDSRGRPVVSLASGLPVKGGGVAFVWTGKTSAGRRAPDGVYTVVAQATESGGSVGEGRAKVVVDTVPPYIAWRGAPGQRVFSPLLPLPLRVADARGGPVHLRFQLRAQNGTALAHTLRTVRKPAKVRLGWSPRPGRSLLTSGAYRVSVTARDGAGNTRKLDPRPYLVERAVGSRVVARVDAAGRRVALTFDDCSSPSAWATILQILARRSVKAAFFCPGRQVAAAPSAARRTLRDGHTIGSHGWDHSNFRTLSYGSALDRLIADREVWWRLARGAATPFFRPPYGAYNATTLAAAGRAGYSTFVLWDVDPHDWTSPGAGAIVSRVLSAVRPGSIVLLHVTWQTAQALPAIVRGLRARRLHPASLEDLLHRGRPTRAHWPRWGHG